MTQPTLRRYSETHQWISPIDNDVFYVGITDFAQQQLGDVMFMDLPKVGTQVKQNESCATVESVKSASDVYAPVSGTIIEINNQLADKLESINQDPYGSWLFKIQCSNMADFEQLLTEEAYQKLIG
ncbi:MAG: glycine cleavage system protein GcvH [Betaproteobacteria bacterium]|uniref:glycine cleavage system protein GcvH n=1 Tax=Ferrovum sp. PN-J185 TaxID=1356306 RepID=UPI000792B61C|nr:glycine cleavage system protein GcvH [Ferrovum sp. PN-J185]KXW55942.1 glycine cleavage system H protein [Ferrovum sp. PN-J185]MDE1891927.1 glycine cleavage system protein GcvH [Betaproteobacteria bacterium]MDE2056992.1 glycine cleavage system protein GcvH [Betaproteobacteria bacterium]